MKLKDMIFNRVSTNQIIVPFGLILCLIVTWRGEAMHFDKPDLSNFIDLRGDEIEDLRQALKASRLIEYSKNYPLHAAIMRGSIEDIKKNVADLKNIADVDEADDEGKTPLYVAAFYKNIKAINLLLENGANPEKIFQHSGSEFLQNRTYKEINDLLHGIKKIKDRSVPKKTVNGTKNRKKLFDINELKIEAILKEISHDKEKGIAIFTGLINKFIIDNDIVNLKKLIRFRINDKRLKYIILALRNGNIFANAIYYAHTDDYAIVELLLSEMDLRYINEECLIKGYLIAKMKKDKSFLNSISGYIKTYFPNSFVVEKCKAFKCGEEIRAITYHQIDPYISIISERERIKLQESAKFRSLANFCILGVLLIGAIGYQLLKNDQICAKNVPNLTF